MPVDLVVDLKTVDGCEFGVNRGEDEGSEKSQLSHRGILITIGNLGQYSLPYAKEAAYSL